MRTRTSRLLLGVYLAFIVYTDLAFSLARSRVASLPLSVTDYYVWGEVSVTTHVIALVLIVYLFRHLRQQQAAQ